MLSEENLGLRAWLGRLLTPRRSFAYRQLEQQHQETKDELLEARALVSKMYNYILIHHGRVAPVERPERKPQPSVEEGAPEKMMRPVGRRPRVSEIHQKYRTQMRQEHAELGGSRTADEQKERIIHAVNSKPQERTEEQELEGAIDQTAEFIRNKAS